MPPALPTLRLLGTPGLGMRTPRDSVVFITLLSPDLNVISHTFSLLDLNPPPTVPGANDSK